MSDYGPRRFPVRRTARLIRREALRRVGEELNTTSGPGFEGVLARISAEVTAEAAEKVAKKKRAEAELRGR